MICLGLSLCSAAFLGHQASLSNYSASGLDDFGSFDLFTQTCDTFWIPIFDVGSGISSEALLNVVENKNTSGEVPTVGKLIDKNNRK
ncbi:hypothetical protein OsJ_36138 [Oryza sativa Japonica Group]|uniref:Uncharacterized protein n=1 Tax=Oryza sativa subsp. japonica TaxID=39947 RepID=B9GD80_ORYSJ|nr:hypothetical protein OsJ_36138 [Oryza sativa Japonica Group]